MIIVGFLSDAVRNYVPSHTTQVFQTSHQTNLVRENLAEKAFGFKAGCNDDLVPQLRNMILSRDENALFDPTIDHLVGFEKRRDVTERPTELNKAHQAESRGDWIAYCKARKSYRQTLRLDSSREEEILGGCRQQKSSGSVNQGYVDKNTTEDEQQSCSSHRSSLSGTSPQRQCAKQRIFAAIYDLLSSLSNPIQSRLGVQGPQIRS